MAPFGSNRTARGKKHQRPLWQRIVGAMDIRSKTGHGKGKKVATMQVDRADACAIDGLDAWVKF